MRMELPNNAIELNQHRVQRDFYHHKKFEINRQQAGKQGRLLFKQDMGTSFNLASRECKVDEQQHIKLNADMVPHMNKEMSATVSNYVSLVICNIYT